MVAYRWFIIVVFNFEGFSTLLKTISGANLFFYLRNDCGVWFFNFSLGVDLNDGLAPIHIVYFQGLCADLIR